MYYLYIKSKAAYIIITVGAQHLVFKIVIHEKVLA